VSKVPLTEGSADWAASPGTRTGQRSRPITWTAAAATPTGTEARNAVEVPSRPTRSAIGASSPAPIAMSRNRPPMTHWFAWNVASTSAGGWFNTFG
jgi:hypothetical protein